MINTAKEDRNVTIYLRRKEGETFRSIGEGLGISGSRALSIFNQCERRIRSWNNGVIPEEVNREWLVGINKEISEEQKKRRIVQQARREYDSLRYEVLALLKTLDRNIEITTMRLDGKKYSHIAHVHCLSGARVEHICRGDSAALSRKIARKARKAGI